MNVFDEQPAAPAILQMLAHDVRWELVAQLSRSDRRVGELVALTERPQNLVSYHLGRLRAGGVVAERRSSADARDIYYHLDLPRLNALLRACGRAIHPSLMSMDGGEGVVAPAERSLRVLFLCTHNSARSQMAEALMSRVAGGRALVASAGSVTSRVHPLAVRVMAEWRIDIAAARSKPMEPLLAQSWDVVVTVCDRVREVCPALPDVTQAIHWSVADPAAAGGSEDERLAAFRAAAADIATRVRFLGDALGLPAMMLGGTAASGPGGTAVY